MNFSPDILKATKRWIKHLRKECRFRRGKNFAELNEVLDSVTEPSCLLDCKKVLDTVFKFLTKLVDSVEDAHQYLLKNRQKAGNMLSTVNGFLSREGYEIGDSE